MSFRDITFEIDGGIAVIAFNRAEKRNAFSGRMGEELGRAYVECDRDDDIRAVVLTGAGSTFCVGADFSEGADVFEKATTETFTAAGVEPPAFAIRKPVIAAVNGHAIGIGLTLPMQCDIRIFARQGKYGFLHVRRGVLPDAYSHWTVPRAIGFARTAELFLSGRRFDGDEAYALGLASRVLPGPEVLPAAMEIARDIAVNCAPLSVALCKRLLWEGGGLSAEEVGRRETELHHVVMGRADALEGVMAFLERRTPEWKLRVGRDWPK